MTTPPPRLAQPRHLSAIAELDQRCFGNPWSLDVFAQELARSFAELWVLERDEVLLGFTCTWVVADEAHLLRIATDPGCRREGVGRLLLRTVGQRASAVGCTSVVLEVAAGNQAAVGLYRSEGFCEVGRRVGYYRSPPDDALTMRCMLHRPA